MDGLIQVHGGRIANTAGDSVLAEFPSVVNAVECAVAVQEKLGEANAGSPGESALRFRIGVHVGDVVVRDGDLLGDGVNVAARVQGLADSGGVWLSGRAYEEVEGKLTAQFEDRGEQQVKNLARPVKVYALVGARGAPRVSKALPLPDKPSIAVLPFTNMSGDPEQEYFADGTVESLTTALARLRWLFVIARNSSFTYKGRSVDVRQVGRELGVRYVLEGSVRKAGERIRITAQLIEASTGHHIWADSFDGTMESVFELQDKLTERVVLAIEPTLRAVEIDRTKGKPTDSLDAYDLYLRSLPPLAAQTEQSLKEAEAWLQKAIHIDPSYGDALAALADCVAAATLNGWRPDPKQGVDEACEYARRAVGADSRNGETLATAAWAYGLSRRFEPAMDWAEQALHLLPTSVHVLQHCGALFVCAGESDMAIKQFEAAQRLSPVDPRAYIALSGLALAHFFAGRFEETVRRTRRILAEWPSHNISRRYLAAALGHLGRLEEAQAVIAELLRSQPNSCLTRSRQSGYRHQWMLDLYIDGLKLAGLPE
jgi:adenylate cyclase